MRRWVSVAAALATAWTFPVVAHGFGDADVAALQVALQSRGLYGGSVDGSLGPGTVTAVEAIPGASRPLRRRRRRASDAAGARSRATRPTRPACAEIGLGCRFAAVPARVARFPVGKNQRQVRRGRGRRRCGNFQRWAGIDADGRRGRRPWQPCASPWVSHSVGSAVRLAPTRGSGRAGTASTAASTTRLREGAPVLAARPAASRAPAAAGRLGNVVVIDHGQGVRTWYAHLRAVPRPGRTARRAWGNDRSCGCKRPRNRAAPRFRGARPWCVSRPALGTGLSRSGRDNLRTRARPGNLRKSRVLGGRSGGVDPFATSRTRSPFRRLTEACCTRTTPRPPALGFETQDELLDALALGAAQPV